MTMKFLLPTGAIPIQVQVLIVAVTMSIAAEMTVSAQPDQSQVITLELTLTDQEKCGKEILVHPLTFGQLLLCDTSSIPMSSLGDCRTIASFPADECGFYTIYTNDMEEIHSSILLCPGQKYNLKLVKSGPRQFVLTEESVDPGNINYWWQRSVEGFMHQPLPQQTVPALRQRIEEIGVRGQRMISAIDSIVESNPSSGSDLGELLRIASYYLTAQSQVSEIALAQREWEIGEAGWQLYNNLLAQVGTYSDDHTLTPHRLSWTSNVMYMNPSFLSRQDSSQKEKEFPHNVPIHLYGMRGYDRDLTLALLLVSVYAYDGDEEHRLQADSIVSDQNLGERDVRFKELLECFGNRKEMMNLANDSLYDLQGKSLGLREVVGKPLYLYFWGTWCAPCLKDLDSIKGLAEQIGDLPVEIVGVALFEEDKDAWNTFVKEHQVPGVQLRAEDKLQAYRMMMHYGFYGVPTHMLIDAEGRIIDPHAPDPGEPAYRALLQFVEGGE